MRRSDQFILPEKKTQSTEGKYDIYPSFRLEGGRIHQGFDSLAGYLAKFPVIIIDGYSGVLFEDFRERLNRSFDDLGKKVSWTNVDHFLKPAGIINKMISPFLGGSDPLFGKLADIAPEDFFYDSIYSSHEADPDTDINIIYGTGAELCGWDGLLVYIDLPKNEIQFRSRAGSITNLGAERPGNPKDMYKRFYFVDWVVLNRHKKKLQSKIDIIIDGQHPDYPSWMKGDDLRKSLFTMSRNMLRARPWFEPGTWGGSWISDNIEGLNKNVPNYAWSFELITPENGLLLESSGILLEVSFDFIMYQEGKAILGDCFDRFGSDFPIRFDFLDTFDGGNLSVQCHPRTDYMRRNFGEKFTQEETYYILDSKEDACVYLGFNDNIDREEFRNELRLSFIRNMPVDIEKYVQKHPSSKHDLFLIPSGTIHGSGKNNLVLEISSTPYIFTFKMYDWLRPDLDGKPRPLNIDRGMDNLFFDRKGDYVPEHLISKPIKVADGQGWVLWHLPTHETQLYDIHRYNISSSAEVEIETKNKCHVLNLVEGTSVIVKTGNGLSQVFSYAETFVIPAAANSYRIINNSREKAMVVKAFVK
jgi:mannose-6-phosphate isomerase class I